MAADELQNQRLKYPWVRQPGWPRATPNSTSRAPWPQGYHASTLKGVGDGLEIGLV